MLELKDGSLTIGGQEHFRDLSFVVRRGEMVALSGVFRHSVVELLMGFRQPDSGWVSVDCEPMMPRSAPLLRRQMTYVPAALPLWDGSGYPPRVSALMREPFLLSSCKEEFSKRVLMEQWRRLGLAPELYDRRTDEVDGTTLWLMLLSVAGVLSRPIVVAELPASIDGATSGVADYLRTLADEGRAVVVATDDRRVADKCDNDLKG